MSILKLRLHKLVKPFLLLKWEIGPEADFNRKALNRKLCLFHALLTFVFIFFKPQLPVEFVSRNTYRGVLVLCNHFSCTDTKAKFFQLCTITANHDDTKKPCSHLPQLPHT